MTLHISLELQHKRQLMAFAAFCTTLAEASAEIDADGDARQLRLYGNGASQTSLPTDIYQQVAADINSAGVRVDGAATTATRERGKPSAGSARRTKAEIAEDEAADKADAELRAAGVETGATVVDRQISTSPEDRKGPEDSAETQQQDAADEQQENAATGTPTLTLDDVRAVLGKYVKAYGMAAAQEDGPAVITLMFGEGKSKVSDIPDTQEAITKAIAGIEEMIAKNPYKRAADL